MYSYYSSPSYQAYNEEYNNIHPQFTSRPTYTYKSEPMYTSKYSPRRYSTGEYGTYQDNTHTSEAKQSRHESSKRKYSSNSKHSKKYTPENTKPENTKPKYRSATSIDLNIYHIKGNYDIKSWDPDRPPIILAGSVFNAESLGTWIVEWSAYVFRSKVGIVDEVHDFADALSLFDEWVDKLTKYSKLVPALAQLSIVDDFIKSARRIIDNLSALISKFSTVMLDGDSKDGNKQTTDGVCKFIVELFNDLREDNDRRKLIASIRLWHKRLEANCSEILDVCHTLAD